MHYLDEGSRLVALLATSNHKFDFLFFQIKTKHLNTNVSSKSRNHEEGSEKKTALIEEQSIVRLQQKDFLWVIKLF